MGDHLAGTARNVGLTKMPAITDSRYLVTAGWDDVPHLTEQAKRELLESTPRYLRDARSKGTPSLGAGAIYPFAVSDITVKPFAIPPYWKRAYGLDFGWRKTAAIWGAHDPAGDVWYLYTEHYMGEERPVIHAEAIKARGISPIVDDLAAIDGITNLHEFITVMARLEMRGIGGIFGAAIYPDAMDSNTNILYMGQGGLSLPDESYYREEQFAEIRTAVTDKTIKEAFRTGWQADYPALANFIAPLYQTGAGANDGQYSNAEVDKLIAEGNSAKTLDEANTKYQAAQEILLQDLPAIPMWYGVANGGFSTKVSNVTFGWNSVPVLYDVVKN